MLTYFKISEIIFTLIELRESTNIGIGAHLQVYPSITAVPAF